MVKTLAVKYNPEKYLIGAVWIHGHSLFLANPDVYIH